MAVDPSALPKYGVAGDLSGRDCVFRQRQDDGCGIRFTSSMPLMIALAVREMGMTPAEAVWAATAGGARALRRDDIGAIAPGLRADLVLLDAPSRTHLAYRPGVPLVARVFKDGEQIAGAGRTPAVL